MSDVLPTREDGGRIVREAWVAWAQKQPTRKPSWLIPWSELDETDREADRCIYDALLARLRPVWERMERQVNASVAKEVYAAQTVTAANLRAELRACVEALELAHEWAASFPLKRSSSFNDDQASETVYNATAAALFRPGVQAARKETLGDLGCQKCHATTSGDCGEHFTVPTTAPNPALVKRARNAAFAFANTLAHAYPGIRGVYGTSWETEVAPMLERAFATFVAEVASTRHYVCEAHVPLGEPGNHDEVCPCCEVVRLAAREARLREALEAWKVRLSFVGHPHECRQPDGTPDWSGVVKLTDAALAESRG